MALPLDRRSFLAAAAAVAAPRLTAADSPAPFKISLAQWSLHKAFFGRTTPKADPLRFAEIAKTDYGIEAVEYVSQFYKDKKSDESYVRSLKKVADDSGVKSVLIMVDLEGALGDPDAAKRAQTVANHRRWLEWAKQLGCHSIRVNAEARNVGTPDEQAARAADGLRALTEAGEPLGVSVIVENHGGLSSNGEWLAGVIKRVGHKGCGTLPDFGNFWVKAKRSEPRDYDLYKGVDELMPFAKGVSAKSYDFDADGNHTTFDYRRLLETVVRKHKYNGYIGIEYEGDKLNEADGIRATKKLLEAVRAELARG